jgi:hypothetical protein
MNSDAKESFERMKINRSSKDFERKERSVFLE